MNNFHETENVFYSLIVKRRIGPETLVSIFPQTVNHKYIYFIKFTLLFDMSFC